MINSGVAHNKGDRIMTDTEFSLENVFKSRMAFNEYVLNNPMPTKICEIMQSYPHKNTTRIAELTQNFETLLNLVGNEDFDTNQYLVWIVVNPKEKIVITI